MISDKVVVADRDEACEGLDAALELVGKTAIYKGYAQAQAQDLRTMAEEMVVGAAAILAVFFGTMWVETDDRSFSVLLEMKGVFTQEARDRLVALTKDNHNTLPKGFFAKLGVLLGDALTGEYLYPYDATTESGMSDILWNQAQIAEMIAEMDNHNPEDAALGAQAKECLDTMADEVIVSAQANQVRITARKALPNL